MANVETRVARIAEATAGKRKFIPFLREPYSLGQVGRLEHRVQRTGGTATTATVELRERPKYETAREAKLTSLNFDWPEDGILTLDDDECVFQYVGTTWSGVPIFDLLDDKRSYEAFKALNGEGLLP